MKNGISNIAISLVIALSVVTTTPRASAFWGDAIPAAFMKHAMEEARSIMQGLRLGAAKMAAMRAINAQVAQLIGGGAGGPRFITNWQDALYVDPEREAQLYMNDFFTLTTRGMASPSNYVGTGDFGIGGGNYAQYLTRVGESAISGGQYSTITLNEYTPSPQVMFENGDWRAFDSFISNPLNNPYGYSIAAEQAHQTFLEQQREIARTQAIAYQGFKGTEGAGGIVLTPGSTIKSLMDNTNDIGNKLVAGATNPTELLGALTTAATTNAINGVVQQVSGIVQTKVAEQIGLSGNQARAIINGATNVLGPGARFIPAIQREAEIKIRAYTNPANAGSYDP